MNGLIDRYRDKNLKRIDIKITPFSEDYQDNVGLAIEIARETDVGRDHFRFSIHWSGTGYVESDSSIVPQTMLLIKWSILNGYLMRFIENEKNGNENIIYGRAKSIRPGRNSFHYYVTGEQFRVIIPALEEFRIQEHRLARRIVLHLFYDKEKLTRDDIMRMAYFDWDIVNQELNALLGSRVLEQQPDNPKNFFATLRARELYESESHSNQGIVFIIAACNANNPSDQDAHKSILDAYSEVIQKEFGLTPIFQESEEPEKNIYVDIFNYIDKSDFVIADITYDRPNCYIETGYAIAKGKHIIGFKQKEWSDAKPADKRIPFDLFPVRFQDYGKGNVADVTKKLTERIRIIMGRQR